ncbi:MAG: hypothetical protein FJ293_06555 [Planctomycetes bacterium]|nr:hypothetical protein [Planctomycetota bacterium]
MRGRRPSFLALGLLGSLLLAPGCVTAALWEELPDRDCGRIDWSEGSTLCTMALTPVTVAADVALVASVVWLVVVTDGGCGCDSIEIDFD